MAIADSRPHTAAPTQDTAALARLAESGPGADAEASVAPGRYLAVEDGGRTALLPITGDVCHVGRSPSCEVVLEDPSVSRRHAVIIRRGERSVILDDRSLNGVQVDDRRVAESVLRDGDVFSLGRVVVRYVEVASDGDPAA